MTPKAVTMGVLVVVAVAILAVPEGALVRWTLRRRRGGRHPDGWPGLRGSTRSGRTAVGRILTRQVEGLGRSLRALARRPSDARADLRVGVAALVGVVVAVLLSPLLALPAVALSGGLPAWRDRAARRTRARLVRATLPDVIDLFRLAVGAGLSVHQAIDAVAPRSPEPVHAALEEVRRRVALGARLGDAYDALDALGDPVLPLAAALRGAARHGAPLASALERVAADARVLRRRRAEEDARRLPVQLLFPLVLCVLPAFGLLAVVPLLLASLRSLQF